MEVFTSQCLADGISFFTSYSYLIVFSQWLVNQEGHIWLLSLPRSIGGSYCGLAVNINQIYHRGEGANWDSVQSMSDFPSTKEEQILGAGWLLSKAGPNVSPDSSVTAGKLFLPLSLLSYSQDEANESTHL